MQWMNNSAEPSSPPHIPFRYLGLLGDGGGHVPVGLGGPLCRLAMPESVITLQVSNLETETRGTASESTSERSAAAIAAGPPAGAAAKLWSGGVRVWKPHIGQGAAAPCLRPK